MHAIGRISTYGGARLTAPAPPAWPRSRIAVAVRSRLQAPTFGMLASLAVLEVSGAEVAEVLELVSPPVIFATNHASHLDSPTLLRGLPDEWRRRTAVAAAADYFFTSHC
ncbi:MAG: hypothetical protein HY329_19415 [Chloroflexi bacterium]|nr:hypothetical protein [Chloroflexota bacterium]